MNTTAALELRSLHVPLGLTVSDALKVLRELELPITESEEGEHCFRVNARGYDVAIYPINGFIRSVWYDDPCGRAAADARRKKVGLYLSRYGALTNWEMRMSNGWMDYWYNDAQHVGMVYGLHMDVIRFNRLDV